MATRFEFEIKEKGRAVLPAGLRSACGFEVGARVVARPIGPGQAIIETTDAVLKRLWAGIPDDNEDAVGDLGVVRSEQVALQELRGASSPLEDSKGSEERSDALLRALGIA